MSPSPGPSRIDQHNVQISPQTQVLETIVEDEYLRAKIFYRPLACTAAIGMTLLSRPVDKRLQEFKTLKFLTQNAERVISRDELLNEVWGYQNYPSTRTVDNHILKLRQKLEKDPANPVHFRTVHGMGYKFVP